MKEVRELNGLLILRLERVCELMAWYYWWLSSKTVLIIRNLIWSCYSPIMYIHKTVHISLYAILGRKSPLLSLYSCDVKYTFVCIICLYGMFFICSTHSLQLFHCCFLFKCHQSHLRMGDAKECCSWTLKRFILFFIALFQSILHIFYLVQGF